MANEKLLCFYINQVYNLVGVVRCHDDDDASRVEVDFHDTNTHHSFSLPNSLEHTMAALNHQALALACQKTEDRSRWGGVDWGKEEVGLGVGEWDTLLLNFLVILWPSQLQCVHFSSWDSQKDWITTLSNKESIQAVAIGDGWIAVATNKLLLRLFSVGGVQREVISVPGHVITLVGWGRCLSVVYQTPPCEYTVTNDYVMCCIVYAPTNLQYTTTHCPMLLFGVVLGWGWGVYFFLPL